MAITQTDWNKSIREHPLFAVASAIEGYKFYPLLKSKAAFDVELKRIVKHIEKNKDKLTPEQTATYEKVLADMAQEKTKTQNKKTAPEQKIQNDTSKEAKTPEKVSESEVQETSDTNKEKQPQTPENPLQKDSYYQIAQLAGMDVSLYDSQDPEVSKKISKDLRKKISQNTDEDNQKIREALKDKKYLLAKFEKTLKQIQEKKQNIQKGKKDNSTKTPKKEGENNMTDSTTKDYQKELEASAIYRLAQELHIDISAYKAANKEDFDKISDEIKNAVKKHQQEQTEEQRKNELDGLKKDKPDLAKEYENIEKEDKPRETLNVENKETEPEEKTPDLSWIEQKKAFWADYAKENSLAPDFNIPEGDDSKVYCKLSNGEKEEGVISYSSPNNIKIAKESSLTIYQGLVKDAVKSNLSITFGKSLNETQQLMLYAAVLLSEDKYEGTNEKAQVLNPPPLDELIKSDAFKNLPDEAQKVLKVKYHVQRLREVVKNPAAHLSPEELKKRQAKKDEIDKINAARFGITGEYKTKYDHDVKIKEGKEEKIIHKKGDERIVTPDKDLFMKDGKLKSAYSQQTYDALLKRKKELEGK